MGNKSISVTSRKRAFVIGFFTLVTLGSVFLLYLRAAEKQGESKVYYKAEQLGLVEEDISEDLGEMTEGTRDYVMLDIEREYIIFMKENFIEIIDDLDSFRALNVNKEDSENWVNSRNEVLDKLEEDFLKMKEFSNTPKQYKEQRAKLIESMDEYLLGIDKYRELESVDSDEAKELLEIESAESFASGSVKFVKVIDDILSKKSY